MAPFHTRKSLLDQIAYKHAERNANFQKLIEKLIV